MLKCLVSLKSCIVRQVYTNSNSTIPMPFATVEDAQKYAEDKVLNKKFPNIANANKVFAFQVLPYNNKANLDFDLLG